MKRTFERILFIVIGAFLVSISYIIGCNSSIVAKQDPVFGKITQDPVFGKIITLDCDLLRIKGGLTISDTLEYDTKSAILIRADNFGAKISIVGGGSRAHGKNIDIIANDLFSSTSVTNDDNIIFIPTRLSD